MKNFAGLIAGVMALWLSGCVSIPMANEDQDAKAKNFYPTPDKSSLYIFRNESFGAGAPFLVTVNGRALGQTGAQTFFRLDLTPGKYNIESHAENVSSLSLTMGARKNYFVWQEVKLGMFHPRSMLQQVDESTGRAGVLESKLISTAGSGDDLLPLAAPAISPAAPQ